MDVFDPLAAHHELDVEKRRQSADDISMKPPDEQITEAKESLISFSVPKLHKLQLKDQVSDVNSTNMK